MKPILFLDIDGVLCTDFRRTKPDGSYRFNPQSVDALAHILEQTGAKIVVSSTWRKMGLSEFLAQWEKRKMPGEILDVTGNSVSRSKEITDWLTLHPEVTAWCAIDDEHLFEQCSWRNDVYRHRNFVRTVMIYEPEVAQELKGLNMADAEQVIRLLKAQMI